MSRLASSNSIMCRTHRVETVQLVGELAPYPESGNHPSPPLQVLRLTHTFGLIGHSELPSFRKLSACIIRSTILPFQEVVAEPCCKKGRTRPRLLRVVWIPGCQGLRTRTEFFARRVERYARECICKLVKL